MAITFSVRGNDLKPHYAEDTTYASDGNVDPSSITDAGAIGGTTLDLGGSGVLTQHRIHYNGINNWPNTRTFSALLRFYLYDNTQTCALFSCCGGGRAGIYGFGGFEVRYDSTNFVVGQANSDSITGINAATFAHGGLSNATYYDLFITGTGDTTTNGYKVYLNASLLGQTTSTRAWESPRKKVYNALTLGACNNVVNTYIRVNEFVLSDSIDDHAPYIGAARTSFVDVAAYDGSAASGSGSISLGGIRV